MLSTIDYDKSRKLCAETVEQLGGPKEAYAQLAFYTSMPDWRAGNHATAITLMGFCGKRARPLLVELLASKNPYERDAAAHALGMMGAAARDTRPALRKLLKDPEGYVRDQAAEALGRINAVVPETRSAVEDSSGTIPLTPAVIARP